MWHSEARLDEQGDVMKSENPRGRIPAERRWSLAALSLGSKIIAPIFGTCTIGIRGLSLSHECEVNQRGRAG